jgi:hypothetical protein
MERGFNNIYIRIQIPVDRLCGLLVRIPGYRSGGPGFDSRALQEKKSSGSGTGSTQPLDYNCGATWKKY